MAITPSEWIGHKIIILTADDAVDANFAKLLEIGDSSGGDFHLCGDCLHFPHDIVFSLDGTTETTFWIEDESADPIVCKVLVGTALLVHIYYGNNSVTATASEIASTFPSLGDHFDVGSTWAEWTELADCGFESQQNALEVCDGLIYNYGGTSYEDPDLVWHDELEAYDPETDSWAAKASHPTDSYQSILFYEVFGVIYKLGGLAAPPGFQVKDDVDYYTPSPTNAWTVGLEAIPIAVEDGPGCVIDDLIYVAGGWDSTIRDELQVYDPDTDSWDTGADVRTPTVLGDHASAYDGNLYKFGGCADMSGYAPLTPATIVNEYYRPPPDNDWNSLFNCTYPSCYNDTVIIGDTVYKIGGNDVTRTIHLRRIVAFDIGLNAFAYSGIDPWTKAFPWLTASAALCAFDGEIYQAGGKFDAYLDIRDKFFKYTGVIET